MAKIFEILTDLDAKTQREVARIQAIDSGLRTTQEAEMLTNLAPYLTNEIILKNAALEIVIAKGSTVPSAYTNFAKGAFFLKYDNADGVVGVYQNVGTNTSCNFVRMIEEGTPVNAVAATGTLTSDNTNVANNDTVTIGSQVYTFKTSLTASTTAYEVLIGSDADDSLLNLKKAINLEAGGGTKYGSLTPANSNVSCGAVTSHAVVLTALVKGTAANSVATTETSTHLSFGAATLAGGVDGTVAHALKQLVDSSYLYVAIAANTVADANWRRISLGSAF